MRHRNLVEEMSPHTAVVADVLERGTLTDWRLLAAQIRSDPYGPYARAVERVLSGPHIYGTSIVWADFLELCQQKNGLPREPHGD